MIACALWGVMSVSVSFAFGKARFRSPGEERHAPWLECDVSKAASTEKFVVRLNAQSHFVVLTVNGAQLQAALAHENAVFVFEGEGKTSALTVVNAQMLEKAIDTGFEGNQLLCQGKFVSARSSP